jgi:hypothetical protein
MSCQVAERPVFDVDNPKELEKALHEVFLEFARFGTRTDTKHMDSFRFMKLCRECCLTTNLADNNCVDLIFYKVSPGPHVSVLWVPVSCKKHHTEVSTALHSLW